MDLNSILQNRGIKTRIKYQGIWLSLLVPACILISYAKHSTESSGNYKLLAGVASSFLSTALLILLQCYIEGSLIFLHLLCLSVSTVVFLVPINDHAPLIFTLLLVNIFYDKMLYYLLKICPKTFTLGEASVLLQSFLMFLFGCYFNFGIQVSSDMATVTLIIQMGLIAMSVMCITTYYIPIARRSVSFYMILIASVGIVLILLSMHMPQFPLLWFMEFICASKQRIYLMVFWTCIMILTVFTIRMHVQRAQKASTRMRKVFHVVSVLILVPGILYECTLLYLATGITLGILILIELCRLVNVPPVHPYLQDVFVIYADEKDCGCIAMTHIYLIAGLALPLWMHPVSCDLTDNAGIYLLPMLAGVLTVGIGDTAASVFGSLFGRWRWRGSNKTIEGTVACIASQLAVLCGLSYYGVLMPWNKWEVCKMVGAVTVTALVEANTSQVDNIALPLIMYILLI